MKIAFIIVIVLCALLHITLFLYFWLKW